LIVLFLIPIFNPYFYIQELFMQTISTNSMRTQQKGMSILSLLFWVAILGSVLLLAMKCVGPISEYFEIKGIMHLAKSAGDPTAIRNSFDQGVKAGYSGSINGRDLNIETANGITTVGFAYKKIVPIATIPGVAPVSLMFEFSNTEIAK
jgi:hypothetical protein